jgi:hypothetical protein
MRSPLCGDQILEALREALPGSGIAAAVINEQAVVQGLGKAIDSQAIGERVKGVIASREPAAEPAE